MDTMNTILAQVKLALRITADDFDTEIVDLINSCLADLGIAGITTADTSNALLMTAIKTYCKCHFGDVNGAEQYDRLKASYDEQKAQMQMATGYTNW